jgi:hypothetical protein
MHVFSLIMPALAFTGGAACFPPGQYSGYASELGGDPFVSNHTSLTTRQSSKPALRILPLGASIVSGVGSSTGNG